MSFSKKRERYPVEHRSITQPRNFIFNYSKYIPKIFKTETVIFSYSKEVMLTLLNSADKDKSGTPIIANINMGVNNVNPLYFVRKGNGLTNFAIINPQAGAANIAILAEELRQMRFQFFLSIGPAGHVYQDRPSLEIGDFIIANKAYPYEATSIQYNTKYFNEYFKLVKKQGTLRPPSYNLIDGGLVKLLKEGSKDSGVKLKNATVATTGAFYRESPLFCKEILSRGASVIDMETSGLYSSLKDKRVEAVSLLYIVDRLNVGLNPPVWGHEFSAEAVNKAQKNASELCIKGLNLDFEYYANTTSSRLNKIT